MMIFKALNISVWENLILYYISKQVIINIIPVIPIVEQFVYHIHQNPGWNYVQYNNY